MRAILLLTIASLTSACAGVSKFDVSEIGSRDAWQRPADVIEVLGIEPGQRVADLGAGDGYFVPHLARAVGATGRVYAVDADADTVMRLEARVEADRLANVEVVFGDYDDPRLPDGAIDVILLVNTYHHIEARPEYFARLKRDLAPGGRVAVIDPNETLTGVLTLFLDAGHTTDAAALRAEMLEAGYRQEIAHELLPVQIFEVYAPAGGAETARLGDAGDVDTGR